MHRDIKPENILLTADGRAKVGDFGIAHVPRAAGGAYVGGLTQTGFQPGTLIYMSPEQICGEAVDGRSDVYQVGALLYEMLAGRHYIDVDTLTRRAQATAGGNVLRMQARLYDLLEEAICKQVPPDVRRVRSDVPEWLGAAVIAMLTRQVAYRPAARQLVDELRHKKNDTLLEQGSASRQSVMSVSQELLAKKQPERAVSAEPSQPIAVPATNKVISPAIPAKNEPPVIPPPAGAEPFWRRWLHGLSGQQQQGSPGVVVSQPTRRQHGVSGQVWRLPKISEILEDISEQDIQREDIRKRMRIIEDTLAGFGVPVSIVEVNQGPAVTQFGLRPGVKVRVSQIQALVNDLSLALGTSPIRLEAPVAGRDFIGLEVPNVHTSVVSLRGVMDSQEWVATKGSLVFGLGRDVSGQPAVADLARMPHLLVGGATGSGKSVCINAIIASLLLTHTPDTLRLLAVDPRRVELAAYDGIPHLIAPVIVDVERAVPALQWAIREMDRRYKQFAKLSVRNIESYNENRLAHGEPVLPYIVIFIDALGDLMVSAREEMERCIGRIAQMANVTGIHMVLATQRPSVDVVSGSIKANFPARIALAVASQIDSRVILDTPGAEQLLGRGDMLFMSPDSSKPTRVQGCFVSNKEIDAIVRFWKSPNSVACEMLASSPQSELIGKNTAEELDELLEKTLQLLETKQHVSISLLQRKLHIGYPRAALLIEVLEELGYIGPDEGSRNRRVLKYSEDRQVSGNVTN